MQHYNKAIAAFATPLILSLLLPFGITEATPVGEAITMMLTAVGTASAVYFVRNK